MGPRSFLSTLLLCMLAASGAHAQDPTGAIEGAVADETASVVPGARIVARHLETGFTSETVAGSDGFFRLLLLPVGPYSVIMEAPQFATLVRQPIQVNVSQTVRVNVQLEVSSVKEEVTVSRGAPLVDTATNALGRVVTGREIVDLPTSARSFRQVLRGYCSSR
ncbi:MAG: carboxypeptidase-like regulatory domain-containing protein [Vicinamibacteraceae bacterium]